ncbi:MAG: RNA polymerase sigma factor [Rhodothermales bacterium]
MTPSDEELLDRARRGDHRAFQYLVERYEAQVAATVVGMLGQGPEAEDVGQETFIRFYSALHTFRGDARLGTYLTRIAINESIKALRRRQRRVRRFLRRDAEETPLDLSAIEHGHTIDDRERAEMVHKALKTLNPAHRAVVVLRMLEGYSTRETAALLNVPEGTVMSRLSRALDKLERILGPILGE